jgi:transposase
MKRYRMDNWSEYNRALINRGSITVWIEGDSQKRWFATPSKGKLGRPQTYSDDAILLLLVLREVYHLPLRALQGYAVSIFLLMRLSLKVPSYTQISRRASQLNRRLRTPNRRKPVDIVFDSTGLKIYGEGEWKVRTHGKDKRRKWKKFHVGIDPQTQEVLVFELTDNSSGDAETAEIMLERIRGRLGTISGDGAYDSGKLRDKVLKRGGRNLYPPPKNAKYKGARSGWERERDIMLAEIQGLGGDEEARKLWKKMKGYYRRSLVETTMFRLKRLFGDRLRNRKEENQQAEIFSKILILNKFLEIGKPKNGRVDVVEEALCA